MTRSATGPRLVTALVAALIVLGLGAMPGAAQDGGEPTLGAADFVNVSCVADAGTGTTTCTFTPVLAGEVPPDAITIAYGQLCGVNVVSAGAGVADGSGYRFTASGGALSAVLTLAGAHAVSSTAGSSYTVEVAGSGVAVSGPALECGIVATPPPPPAQPVTVSVAIYAIDCAADPGPVASNSLPAGCAPSVGLAVDGSVDGIYVGTAATDGAGWAFIAAPAGSTLVVVEQAATIAAGYASVGDGSAVVSPVSEGAAAVLVHVATGDAGEEPGASPAPSGGDGEVSASEEDPTGRVQLVKGTCPTTGEPRTELTVIGPNTLQAQAESVEGCSPTPGAEFLVTGGDLPAEGSIYVTGEDGAYRGVLPPGSYNVTEVLSGESVEIQVVVDDIVVVVAIEYVLAESGTIAVRRYVCIDGDTELTTIDTYLDPPAEPDPGEPCAAEEGDFQLNDAEAFSGGGDGAITFSLPIGTYQFTDLDTTTSVSVDITAASTTYVLVRRVIPAGELSVAYTYCDDEDAYQGSPYDPGYWPETCPGTTAGVEIRLIDAAGNIVGSSVTDDDGIVRWSDLDPGVYRIRGRGDRATCAVFVGGSASIGGFSVAANTIYQGSVYGCVKPPSDDGTGGNGTGNGTGGNGTGNGTGGNGTGNGTGGNSTGGNSTGGPNPQSGGGGTGEGSGKSGSGEGGGDGVDVTALPNTGTAGQPDQSSAVWPLIAFCLVIGGMGAEVWRRRRAA